MESLWGFAYFAVVFAAVLALPVTLFLLGRYKSSVARLMQQRGSGAGLTHTSGEQRPPIAIGVDARLIKAKLRRNMTVVVAVGVVTGVAFAILFLARNDVELSPYRIAFLSIPYAWPAVIGIWIVTGGRRNWVWGSLAVYFTLLWAAGLIGGLNPLDPLVPWLWTLIPTAAIIAFLSRPLRGVGTLVLGAMMVGVVGSQAIAHAMLGSDTLTDLWVEIAAAFGITDASVSFWGLMLAAFLVSLFVGALAVRWLAAWYHRQGFSDQMLLLGSVFLVFAVDAALTIRVPDTVAFVLGIAIYLIAGVASMLLYRLVHTKQTQAVALLMLRVFSPRLGSQPLLDGINARWRHLGPVRMIGGPDLAVATVEPHEFLTFVRGGLRRLFIDSPAVLEERLGALTDRPDPDARYRIDEFFCFDDTWRLAVAELLERSHAVVMDLRGFGPDNSGCIDEIEMLAAHQALNRTVLLVDGSTDRMLLNQVLGSVPATEGPSLLAVDDDRADEAVVACLSASRHVVAGYG